MRHGRLLLGLLLLGLVSSGLASCKRGQPVPAGPPGAPGEFQEVDCVKEASTCPLPGEGKVCRIFIGKTLQPAPKSTCVHRNQTVRFRLDDQTESASVRFRGDMGPEIFKDFPSNRRLDLSRGNGEVYWDGVIRADAAIDKNCFSAGTVQDCDPGDGGDPPGEPGELEVVRDPGYPPSE